MHKCDYAYNKPRRHDAVLHSDVSFPSMLGKMLSVAV